MLRIYISEWATSQRSLHIKGRKPKEFREIEGLWALVRVHLSLKIMILWSVKIW